MCNTLIYTYTLGVYIYIYTQTHTEVYVYVWPVTNFFLSVLEPLLLACKLWHASYGSLYYLGMQHVLGMEAFASLNCTSFF